MAYVDWALARPEGELEREAPDTIVSSVRHVTRGVDLGPGESAEEKAACKRGLYARLADQKTCGRAAGAIAAGLFGVSGVDPRDVARAVEGVTSLSCGLRTIEAAGFAGDVDLTLAKAIERFQRSAPDEETRRTAWLAYGSIGEIAGRRGRADVVSHVEGVLAPKLEHARGEERVLMLRAAGNAGCRRCLPALRAALADPSPSVRERAAAAFRFVDDAEAVQVMCTRLLEDADGQVRDLSAWSLQWRLGAGAERARCLARAAKDDTNVLVRRSSARSLGLLAKESAPAHEALLTIAGDDYPDDVREIALGHLTMTTARTDELGGTGIDSLHHE